MDYAAEITISATPETVWAILADTDSYSSFDPGIARIVGGPLDPGRFAPEVRRNGREVSPKAFRLLVYSMEDGDQGRLYRVTEFGPPRWMVWTEKATFGLVVRERSFLVDARAGTTRFRIAQVTTGWLGRFASRWEPDLTEAFRRFCSGLRDMAETTEAVQRERRAR